MNLHLSQGLPFATVSVFNREKRIELERVLIDTGSATTIFSADKLAQIDIQMEPDDTIHRIRGVGGSEFVFAKNVEQVSLGDLAVGNFEIEVGALDYGFGIEGIIGMDFLQAVGAILDLAKLEIYS